MQLTLPICANPSGMCRSTTPSRLRFPTPLLSAHTRHKVGRAHICTFHSHLKSRVFNTVISDFLQPVSNVQLQNWGEARARTIGSQTCIVVRPPLSLPLRVLRVGACPPRRVLSVLNLAFSLLLSRPLFSFAYELIFAQPLYFYAFVNSPGRGWSNFYLTLSQSLPNSIERAPSRSTSPDSTPHTPVLDCVRPSPRSAERFRLWTPSNASKN